jgi:hypothetical protein
MGDARGTLPQRRTTDTGYVLASDLSVSISVTDVDTVLTAARERVEAFMARLLGITHG